MRPYRVLRTVSVEDARVSPAACCPAGAAAEELAATATATMPSTSKWVVSLLKTFETTMTS
jgi:hypothetical protein